MKNIFLSRLSYMLIKRDKSKIKFLKKRLSSTNAYIFQFEIIVNYRLANTSQQKFDGKQQLCCALNQ